MTEPCAEHAALNASRGDRLVEVVDGPIARLIEWGRMRGEYPDDCPGTWSAHYSLNVAGVHIADTSSLEQAQMLRRIAVALNKVGAV